MKKGINQAKQMILLISISLAAIASLCEISTSQETQFIRYWKAALRLHPETNFTQLSSDRTVPYQAHPPEAGRGDIIRLEKISNTLTKSQDKSERKKSSRIQFINDAEGWASLHGELWYTQTHGETWEMIYKDPANSIRSFEFINPRTGWLLTSGKMYKTQDGGRSWELFNQPIGPEDRGDPLCFKFFKDGKEAWVGGGIFYPIPKTSQDPDGPPTRYASLDGKSGLRGAIFHTTDGGVTWRQELCANWGYISKLFFLNAEEGWATGMAGIYYYKRGQWHAVSSQRETELKDLPKSLEAETGFPSAEPIKLFFSNNTDGWLSNSNGAIGRSTDGGRTWIDISRGVRKGGNDLPVFFKSFSFWIGIQV
jgi:photosystem II stability/assembly factor-like uncharacterized protein